MTLVECLSRAAAAAMLAMAPVWAQGGLDADTLKAFGGTYSTDCGNAKLPFLRVAADALIVDPQGTRLTGQNVQAAAAFFGQSPPPNYRMTLMSEVRGGSQLLFIVFRDTAGQYITIDGDAKVRTALGSAQLKSKFRHCAPQAPENSSQPPKKGALPPNKSIDEPMLGPTALLKDPKFRSLYYRALGPKVSEAWLAKLDGPAPPMKRVKVVSVDYTLASACKNHDCGDNNAVLLYSPNRSVVYGKIFQRGRTTLIGAPPPAVAAELDRLWLAEWRSR